jgi:hypothetical protein
MDGRGTWKKSLQLANPDPWRVGFPANFKIRHRDFEEIARPSQISLTTPKGHEFLHLITKHDFRDSNFALKYV